MSGELLDDVARFLGAITLYQDDQIWALNKPAGLPVQAGMKTPAHLEAMLAAVTAPGAEQPRLVHRLDKDTAGCLLIGRTLDATRRLGRQFERRTLTKIYWALVHGVPDPLEQVIDMPLIKVSTPDGDRVRAAQPHEPARAAATRYRVLQARGAFAWLELEPLTGRQHQLRAHMVEIGHPILGDPRYHGGRTVPAGLPAGLNLLARTLAFRHPNGGEMRVEAPLAPHMQLVFETLGFSPAALLERGD